MKKICNLTEEQLRQLYIVEQKTIREISQLTAWHYATIFQHLKKLNIPRRRSHYFKKNHITWNKGTKGIMKPNSTSFKKDMTPWNKGLKGYKPEHNGRFKKGQVAWNKGMKLPPEWVEKNRLAHIGHLSSKTSFGKGHIPWNKGIIWEELRGNNHPNWRGGKATLPYSPDFTDILKNQIRQRDNYKCQLCGCSQSECLSPLHIHHIDYNKKNCNPKNLISLCNKCHSKTNVSKREHWKEIFNEKMFLIYNTNIS